MVCFFQHHSIIHIKATVMFFPFPVSIQYGLVLHIDVTVYLVGQGRDIPYKVQPLAYSRIYRRADTCGLGECLGNGLDKVFSTLYRALLHFIRKQFALYHKNVELSTILEKIIKKSFICFSYINTCRI